MNQWCKASAANELTLKLPNWTIDPNQMNEKQMHTNGPGRGQIRAPPAGKLNLQAVEHNLEISDVTGFGLLPYGASFFSRIGDSLRSGGAAFAHSVGSGARVQKNRQ